MPYTGRPRGSSGPVPLIIVGVIFAAIGLVLQGQTLMRSAASPLLALGVIFVIAGAVWMAYREMKQGRWP